MAGCGLLSDGAGQPLRLDALGVAGFGLVAVAPCVLAVDAAQLAGCGLIENPVTGQLDVFSAALTGPGLIPSGLCGLQVNVGCGLTLVGDAVVFDPAAVAGDGLSAVGECGLKVDVGCGIKLELGAVAFDAPAVAGLGLSGAGCFLHVNVGDGLEIVGDTIIVKAGCSIAINAEDGSVEVDVATLAGDGLIASAGEVCDELAVQPGCGLEIAANKSVQIKRSHLIGDGLKAGDGSPCELAVDWEDFPGGCGLMLNGEFWDVDNTTLAGDGLVAGIGCSLAVDTGCGLRVNSGFVELDPDVIAGGGLAARPATRNLSTLADVTAVMTAFRRPGKVEAQVASLRRRYPDLPLVVGDNGDRPARVDDPRTTYLRLPFDEGLSRTRNTLARLVTTDLVLLLDDDYLWTERTRIEPFLDVLNTDPTVGVVGGVCEDLLEGRRRPVTWANRLSRFRGRIVGEPARDAPVRIANGGTPYQLVDTALNFALFRREVLLEHPWREELKVMEHWDFYWRLREGERWRVALVEESVIDHDRSGSDAEYDAFRYRREHSELAMRLNGVEGVSFARFDETPPRDRGLPNLIVLTPGHTGSSIVTWLLHQLGWNAPVDVDQFAEPVGIRRLNERCLAEGGLDREAARAELARLPTPWALKDPRFARTMSRWVPLLEPYAPALLFLSRDSEVVRASFERRGGPADDVEVRITRCRAIFDSWPWRRVEVDFDDLSRVLQAFDPSRCGGDGHGVDPTGE